MKKIDDRRRPSVTRRDALKGFAIGVANDAFARGLATVQYVARSSDGKGISWTTKETRRAYRALKGKAG